MTSDQPTKVQPDMEVHHEIVAEAVPAANQPQSTTLRGLVDNRWVVLGTLFGVTAALGLPLLWASRAFSTTSKIVWSVIVLLYTILILWLFWLVVVWSYTRIVDAL